ncbi:YbaK/EbsC family protein [Bradyrhizobium sp. 2TAF24]|uniref:YbaK/EbsC family protein n=1 Tax=Bradyrhizobium sp. 2TAF24 TaxID=3233011 RepID=UPI003F939F17
MPALGAAYGLKVIVDDSLANEPEIYFEGGDHASLVHVAGSTFQELLADARHARFTE